MPDLALEYEPGNIALLANRDDYSDRGSSESGDDQGDVGRELEGDGRFARPKLIPFPQVIFEIGDLQKYPVLLADCEDYLLSSQEAIKIVFIILIDCAAMPHKESSSGTGPSACDADNDDQTDVHIPPPSSPDSIARRTSW